MRSKVCAAYKMLRKSKDKIANLRFILKKCSESIYESISYSWNKHMREIGDSVIWYELYEESNRQSETNRELSVESYEDMIVME